MKEIIRKEFYLYNTASIYKRKYERRMENDLSDIFFRHKICNVFFKSSNVESALGALGFYAAVIIVSLAQAT